MFCNGGEGLAWVREQLAKGGPATIAVAFWGAGAAQALGLTERANTGSVRIICNLAMGGTNPFELRKLQQIPGVSVEQCDRLHGKVYLFEDAAMVGSSNVSSNGLSFEGPSAMAWHEANVVLTHKDFVEAASIWVSNLVTRKVTEKDLSLAEKAWAARRMSMPSPRDKISIRQLLEEHPAAFAGLDIYLTLTVGDLSEEAEAAVEEAAKDHPNVDAWEDWPGLPTSGKFVSFAAEEGGIFEYENCFHRTPEFPDRPKGRGRLSLQWCFPSALPFGLKSPRGERAHWARIIELVLADRGRPEVSGAHCVRLDDLVELWARAQSKDG